MRRLAVGVSALRGVGEVSHGFAAGVEWGLGDCAAGEDDASEVVALDEVERRYILRVMDAVGGNRTRAAEVLGVDRKTLYSKLKSYGWRPSDAGGVSRRR